MPVSVPDAASPLDGELVPGGHGAVGVPGVTLAELRCALHEVAARRGAEAGLPRPGHAGPFHGGTALGLAPGGAIVLGGAPSLPRDVAAVVEQTGGFVLLRLTGPAAAEALARLCRLDLHEAAFPPGRVARTLMAQIAVVLHRDGPASFELLIPATLAASFAHHLMRAAHPFGCAVLPPTTRKTP
jgi:sarcosine oxidase subunit gamma